MASLNRFAIRMLRWMATLVSIPMAIALLPFNVFAFFKLNQYFDGLIEKTRKTDFFDLHTGITAAEMEIATGKMGHHDYPTRHGFIGELLLQNALGNIKLDSIGNKIIVHKIPGKEPDFLNNTAPDRAFEYWKGWHGYSDASFTVGHHFKLKVILSILIALNFFMLFFLPAAVFFIAFFPLTSAILAMIFPIQTDPVIGFLSAPLLAFAVGANVFLFLAYFYARWVQYKGKKEGFQKMTAQYEKSIVLNILIERLDELPFNEQKTLSFFLVYGEFGALALAAHRTKNLNLDEMEIVFE